MDTDFPNNIVYLDIETVSKAESYGDLSADEQALWAKKSKHLLKDSKNTAAEKYSLQAGIYAEFSKVVCISLGIPKIHRQKTPQNQDQDQDEEISPNENSNEAATSIEKNTTIVVFQCKSFFGDDEKKILQKFSSFLQRNVQRNIRFCAHNGKEFDYPFLARRFLANYMPLPRVFQQLQGRKPWENTHLDTLELWKFGDWKAYTSLELLANVLGVPSPKLSGGLWDDDQEKIDGSMVHSLYYDANDMRKIVEYCERDVFCTAQIYARMNGMPLIKPKNFISLSFDQDETKEIYTRDS